MAASNPQMLSISPPSSPEKSALSSPGLFYSTIRSGFDRAFRVCLDELREEPKRLLYIGGCRQLSWARELAFLLPATEIHLLDSDPDIAARAKAEICCRFQFMSGHIEDLPFEDNAFDLTIAPDLPAYVLDWERALAELGRVTRRNLLMGVFRPGFLNWMRCLPGVSEGLAQDGFRAEGGPRVDRNAFLTYVNRQGKIRYQVSPLPWRLEWIAMKPVRETRLIFSSEQ